MGLLDLRRLFFFRWKLRAASEEVKENPFRTPDERREALIQQMAWGMAYPAPVKRRHRVLAEKAFEAHLIGLDNNEFPIADAMRYGVKIGVTWMTFGPVPDGSFIIEYPEGHPRRENPTALPEEMWSPASSINPGSDTASDSEGSDS
jgi:hypothetical protein